MNVAHVALGLAVAGALACLALQKARHPLQPLLDDLIDRAAATNPRFEAVRALITKIDDFPPDQLVDARRKTVRRGKLDRENGVLYIATTRPDGSPLPPGVVKGVLIHEVAHAATRNGNHTAEWRDAYVFLLRLATEQMGWDVTLECSSCRYYGVCGPGHCPSCTWMACRTATHLM